MSTLILARHGETLWHAENRYAGSTDVGLTERGRAQSAALGRWAAGQPLVGVYSSDLSRAVVTATPAANALALPLRVDPRLREVDFGQGEGLTTAEMRYAFPDAVADFQLRPGQSPLPGGESGIDAVDRAWPALEHIGARNDGPVLVVMHSTLMRLVLCRVLGMSLDHYRAAFPAVRNVALTTITLGPAPALHGFNVPVPE
ncbi:histidine phosphatase family protein [Cryobacterium sp. PH31-L1]|uniref:histidine phosphatase family protein n=1 Tax=Cryobacterium sp. PH31-L1 TaxID=3046199 RepID=UPI0024B9BD6E|nr:histidine phosphatase family protein [Cryobacterium sp. PH31-L1]MDJ0378791.1 histidine phosphatase family protein [Cryobacterium sp. PH31-L1]